MGLYSALDSALTGLRFNQTGLGIISSNVSNATNVGYTKKNISPVTQIANEQQAGVAPSAITRELDLYVQKQLRTETSAAGYASARLETLQRLDMAYGTPGSVGAFDTAFNDFTTALQGLSTSPESFLSRTQVLTAGSALADKLRTMSSTVQRLRSDVESAIGETVKQSNELLVQIEKLNISVRSAPAGTMTRAIMLDQRDQAITKLSELMDIRVAEQSDGGVTLSTLQGTTLLSGLRTELSFDGRGELQPGFVYNADDSKRMVGTIKTDGGKDLIQMGAFASGKLKALIELRDVTLPAAQNQFDEVAARMMKAIGTNRVSTPVGNATSGLPYGVDMNLGSDGQGGTGLLDGNTITMTLELGGNKQAFTFKRVDDLGVTISDTLTAKANDRVTRLTGNSAAGYLGQMQAAINAWAGNATAFTVSNAGNVISVRANPGAVPGAGISNAGANLTAQTITNGSPALPLFIDAGERTGLFTGKVTANGPQALGLASRIALNPDIKGNPSGLVQITPATFQGDPVRANFLVQQLANAKYDFNPNTAVGVVTAPFNGTVLGFMRQAMAVQTGMTAEIKRVDEGQKQVVKSLQARFQERSNINMDEEMSRLIVFQQSYGANARVMSITKEMVDLLMKI